MPPFKISQVAIQLYTLRDFCKTVPDFQRTIEKVRKIGYKSVQLSGAGISHVEAKKVLDDAGLNICATHESWDLILKNPEKVSEILSEVGVKHTAYPYPGGIDFGNEEAVRLLARQLDAAGAVLARNGQILSYHNHANEFVRFGASTALDYIFESTNPAHLKAEIDTYWIQYGGGNPVAWVEKLAGRIPLLHLKDYVFTTENKPAFAEVGQGWLDWKSILAAAARGGTEWIIVEQDICARDPFDSIRISFNYLQKLLGE